MGATVGAKCQIKNFEKENVGVACFCTHNTGGGHIGVSYFIPYLLRNCQAIKKPGCFAWFWIFFSTVDSLKIGSFVIL
jgi:hypothetical protein